MKIVLVTDWHSENMGYSDNCIPKYLADLGHEVFHITSNAQCYFNDSNYDAIFGKFNGPGIVACGVKNLNGYVLYRLKFKEFGKKIYIKGLYKLLKEIQPDVVQAGEITSLTTLQVALIALIIKYKLFVECHWHFSVFPIHYLKGESGFYAFRSKIYQRLYWNIYRNTVGRFIAVMSQKCIAIADDSAELARTYFGFQAEKIITVGLGVDDMLFKPLEDFDNHKIKSLREQFGFTTEEVVCIYTGRLSQEKGAHILAEAVALLISKGYSFRALFIGEGPLEYVEKISRSNGCVVNGFVKYIDLSQYYQCADIGVWPLQESTSQLDAIASGLPIVISNKSALHERIDGNGLVYEEGNSTDLATVLIALVDSEKRAKLSKVGLEKIKTKFSWQIAILRLLTEYKKN